jgi:hypothetical protein
MKKETRRVKASSLIVIALLSWPLFKLSYYFATRFEVHEPLGRFDLIAFLAWLFFASMIWLVYSRQLRTKRGPRQGGDEA